MSAERDARGGGPAAGAAGAPGVADTTGAADAEGRKSAAGTAGTTAATGGTNAAGAAGAPGATVARGRASAAAGRGPGGWGRTAVLLAVGATAGGALWGLATHGDGRTAATASASAGGAAARVATGTAVVRTRELVDREDVDGTLGFAGARTLRAAGRGGTLTRLVKEGATVRRGRSLYSVDGVSTAYVLYGTVPPWRALRLGVEDGEDVEQLERNLRALGYDAGHAMAVDEHFDGATAAAVRRWQDARGVAETGAVELGEIVVADGAVRVGEHVAQVGDQVGAGRPVTKLSTRDRIVTARLPAGRQGLVERGDAVTVTLPDGATLRGRVSEVGRVASVRGEGEEATVALQVALRGRAARALELDGAPVTVGVARTAAERATAVPVEALLAAGAGRYAVELAEGSRRLVPVELGAFADGWVGVTGRGLRDGTKVTVPR